MASSLAPLLDHPITILLVEDSTAQGAFIKSHLESMTAYNYMVDWVKSVESGIQRLQGKPYDVVLLDLNLPDSEGLGTFDRIASDARNIPIVVLTALNNERLAINLLKKGAQDYCFKTETSTGAVSRSIQYAMFRKQAEAEILNYQTHLEEMVEQRTHELLVAKQQAEAASRAKSEFLSNMTHELRTPLHHVLNYAQICIKKLGQVPEDKLCDYLASIINSGNNLLALLDNLLDFTVADSDELVLDRNPEDLNRLVDETIKSCNPLIRDKKLCLQFSPNSERMVALIDRTRIGQVIRHLLGNAIKYSESEGIVSLELTSDSRSLKRPGIRFSIMDDGIGIPENELDAVFDRFAQSSLTRRKAGGNGLGLGLSICRAIIEAHDGIIWAKNRPGGGSEFTFVLPCDSSRP